MASDAPAHPGSITYFDDDKQISVLPLKDVPEEGRFAKDASDRLIPIVKVVRTKGDAGGFVVSELGPGDVLLRRTVLRATQPG